MLARYSGAVEALERDCTSRCRAIKEEADTEGRCALRIMASEVSSLEAVTAMQPREMRENFLAEERTRTPTAGGQRISAGCEEVLCEYVMVIRLRQTPPW